MAGNPYASTPGFQGLPGLSYVPPQPPPAQPAIAQSNNAPPAVPAMLPLGQQPGMVLPPELQALNVTPQQFAALLSHLQSGSLPLPPPLPMSNIANGQQGLVPPPPPFAYPTLHHSATRQHFVPQQEQGVNGLQGHASQSNDGLSRAHMMDVDLEEGELSDPKKAGIPPRSSTKTSKKRKATPPTDGANSMRSTRNGKAKKSRRSLPSEPQLEQAITYDDPTPEMLPYQPPSSQCDVHGISSKKEIVLPFVRALHEEGFAFDDFVREGIEDSSLRDVYAELQLPMRTVSGLGAQSQVHQEAIGARDSQASPLPGLGSARSKGPIQSPTQRPTPGPLHSSNHHLSKDVPVQSKKAPVPNKAPSVKPSAPPSRQDYLARLQAAKTKKAENAASKPSPTVSPAAQPADAASSLDVQPSAGTIASATVGNASPGIAVVPTSSQADPRGAKDAEKQRQTTELIRKRMEALKATREHMARVNATKTPTSGGGPSTTSLPQPADPITPQPPAPFAPSDDATATLTPSTHQNGPPLERPLSAIPGLSMDGAASHTHASAAQANSTAPTSLDDSAPSTRPSSSTGTPVGKLSRRPVAADLNELEILPDAAQYRRPFGQSRQNSGDEAMIIQVSDDESDGDAEDGEVHTANIRTISAKQKSIRDLPPLRDFPQRSNFTKQSAPSTVSTPTVNTPKSLVEIERLRRKEQEITALNKRIQEYEMKKAAMKAREQAQQSRPQTPKSPKPAVPPQASSANGTSAPASEPAASPIALPTSQQVTEGSDDLSVPGWVAAGELKAERRSKIQADLSAWDAQINTQKARIEEMQRQVAEMQRQYEEDMAQQQQLRRELEDLDINTDGMTQAEMQAKKDEIDQQMVDSQATESDVSSLNRHAVAEEDQVFPSEGRQGAEPEQENEPSAVEPVATAAGNNVESPDDDDSGSSMSEDSSDEEGEVSESPLENTNDVDQGQHDTTAGEALSMEGDETMQDVNGSQIRTQEPDVPTTEPPNSIPEQEVPAVPAVDDAFDDDDSGSEMDMSSDTSSSSGDSAEDTAPVSNEESNAGVVSEGPSVDETESEYDPEDMNIETQEQQQVAANDVADASVGISTDTPVTSSGNESTDKQEDSNADDIAPELQPLPQQQIAVGHAVRSATPTKAELSDSLVVR